MTNYTIDTDVPMPAVAPQERGFVSAYPFRLMKVGDSVLFDGTPLAQRRAAEAAKSYGPRYGYIFSRRTTPEGTRIWRVK